MSSVREHIARSIERTGKGYEDMHKWMDIWDVDEKLASERHDIINFDKNIPHVEMEWGIEAGKEFLHHIKEDYENGKPLILKILGFAKRKLFG